MSGEVRPSVPARNGSSTGKPPDAVTHLTRAREKGVTGTAGTAGTAGTGLALAVPPELVEVIAERAAELLAERQPQTAPELLTVPEAAAFLRCGKQRIYDLVSQDRLEHLKDGARVLIRRVDLLAYLGAA